MGWAEWVATLPAPKRSCSAPGLDEAGRLRSAWHHFRRQTYSQMLLTLVCIFFDNVAALGLWVVIAKGSGRAHVDVKGTKRHRRQAKKGISDNPQGLSGEVINDMVLSGGKLSTFLFP